MKSFRFQWEADFSNEKSGLKKIEDNFYPFMPANRSSSPHLRIFLNHIILTCVLASGLLLGIADVSFALEDVRFLLDLRAGLQNPADMTVTSTGEIYVLDSRQAKVLRYDSSGQLLGEFGTKGPGEGQFNRPQAIYGNKQGQILIADTGNNRVQVFDQDGRFLFQFGGAGSLSGQFKSPQGITTDHFGLIYVADTLNNRLQIFSSTGVFLKAMTVDHPPVDVDVDLKGNIYVLMPLGERIAQYSFEGKLTQSWTCVLNGQNYIKKAAGIAVDTKGDVYIIETAEHSIKKIDSQGNTLLSFGSEGEDKGQFYDPLRISVTADDKIYIADSRNQRVQVFQVNGNDKTVLQPSVDCPAVVDLDHVIPLEEGIVDLDDVLGRGLYAISKKGNHVLRHDMDTVIIGQRGVNAREFNGPEAVYVQKDGTINVADTENNRIQIFNPDTDEHFSFGKKGIKNGQFNRPQGIGVYANGYIYVADTVNNRVQVFNKEGIFLSAFGARSVNKNGIAEEGNFRSPTDITFDLQGNIYVLDAENNRVQVFNSQHQCVSAIRGSGAAFGFFNQPADIVIDDENYLYVADTGNNRIQIFDSNGQVLSFGSAGMGPGMLGHVSALDVNHKKIYVADDTSSEVKVFTFKPKGVQPRESVHPKAEVVPPDNTIQKEDVELELQ